MTRIHLESTTVLAVSPEGAKASMPINTWLRKIRGTLDGTEKVIFPDGLKGILSRGPYTVWVHESPPDIYNFKWITKDSLIKFGPGATYQDVRIALPFVIILAFFIPDPKGQVILSGRNECFFRAKPLQSYEDHLCFPALLNCSAYKRSPEKNPLSWICTQYLKHSYTAETDINARMRNAFQALHHTLFETAFNLSSEQFEGSSWFAESRHLDERISTIENWQKATAENDAFVLDVPWLETGYTLGQVIERAFANLNAPNTAPDSAEALARIIFNHKP